VEGVFAADAVPERLGVIEIAMPKAVQVFLLKRRVEKMKLAMRTEIGERILYQLWKIGKAVDGCCYDDDIK
jgi:hypothetical protein